MPLSYQRDPDRIFRSSMEHIDAVLDTSAFPQKLQPVVRRLVHACGMPEIAAHLRWHGDPVGAAETALRRGAPIITDCEMVAHGIIRSALPAANPVLCLLNDPRARARGRAGGITRSAAAVELWPEAGALSGAVVAIGNAPTALFRLLEGLAEEGWAPPAALLAFPVGFIGAAESKQALLDAAAASSSTVPAFITLEGRQGGSALAAAALNGITHSRFTPQAQPVENKDKFPFHAHRSHGGEADEARVRARSAHSVNIGEKAAEGNSPEGGVSRETPPSAPWLSVVGVGADGLGGLTADARAHLAAATCIIGGARHLAMLGRDDPRTRIPWPSPLAALLPRLEELRDTRTCILASGDPLCYGIGTFLLRNFKLNEMTILPHVSAFALARARLGWSNHDCDTLTLHGRPPELLRAALHPHARLLVYSDGAETISVVARILEEDGYGASDLFVLENLGGEDERILVGTAREWLATPPPSKGVAALHTIAIACHASADARLISRAPGLPDDLFENDGQITKREVRAAAVSRLAPHKHALLWDLGAGAGSIAIEWLRAANGSLACAVERDAARALVVEGNALRLGVPQLEVQCADIDAFLTAREAEKQAGTARAPDAIFIGGGLSDTPAFAERAAALLAPGGRLVAHAVTLESESLLLGAHTSLGGELTRLSTMRAEALGPHYGWRPGMQITQWCFQRTDDAGDAT